MASMTRLGHALACGRHGDRDQLMAETAAEVRLKSPRRQRGRSQTPGLSASAAKGRVMARNPQRASLTGERDPKRVVAFSDGVIAIAVTLLVLNIRPPSDTAHLLHGLRALWPAYFSYVITFMLVANVWANHHVMFDHIRHADRMVLFLNCVLLMDIAVLPFAAAVLANSFRTGQGERTAVVLHGIVFEVAALLFNIIWLYARRDRLLATTIDEAGARAIGRRFLLGLAWIGVGTLLGAAVPLLGAAVFVSFIIFFWLPISGEIGVARPAPVPATEEAPPCPGPDEAAP